LSPERLRATGQPFLRSLAMAASFPQFLQLPPEIRIQIWELCLPRRVLDIDLPDVYATDPAHFSNEDDYDIFQLMCQFRHCHVKRNVEPPILLRVCQETRDIVLRNGHYIDSPSYDRCIPRLWVQPKRDVLNLNWDSRYDMDGQDSPIWNGTYTHSPVPVTFACADALGVPSIVSHLLVGDFSWPHPDVNVYPSEWQAPADMQLLASRSSPMLISVSTIVLHMNKKSATASGLFGLLGDETVQSVDFYDSGRLRAYYRSWADNCTKTDAWAKNLFKVLLCDSLKHYFLEEWLQNLDFIFIGTLWVEARRQGFDTMENPHSVWVPPVSENKCPHRQFKAYALNTLGCKSHGQAFPP